MDAFYETDIGVELVWQLLGSNKQPKDLSGYTAQLYAVRQDGIPFPASPLQLSAIDAARGEFGLIITTPLQFPAGKYTVQIKVTRGTTELHTDPDILVSMALPVAA